MDSQDSMVQEPLSVTMISREELPSFSTERFFMLSEFHLNAHSVRFVSDLHDSDEVTPETVETTASSMDDITDELLLDIQNQKSADAATPGDDGADTLVSFPPCLIFYVLWRPDMTTSVTRLTDEIILPAVRKLQAQVDIAYSDEEKKRSRTSSYASGSPRRSNSNPNLLMEISAPAEVEDDRVVPTTEHAQHQDETESSLGSSLETGKTRLYLVVDRVVPFNENPLTNDDSSKKNESGISYYKEKNKQHQRDQCRRLFQVETALAERLARHVASHSDLRSVFQGITIGVANHKRAAPGLDACLDVINVGARERRKIGRDVKSDVGVMAISHEDLLGLDEEGETDAAQDILQIRISTEWNGQGNIKSFGYRAHALWRRDRGLPPPPSSDFPLTENKRRTGRRLGPLEGELHPLDLLPLDLLLNFGAFLLVVYYIWKAVTEENS